MKLVKLMATALASFLTVGAQADVLKLDCKIELKNDGRHKDLYMASAYLVDYHTEHGSNGRPAFIVGTSGSLGSADLVGSLAMTSSYADGKQRSVPGDAANADMKITDFVKTEGSKVLVGETRECPNAQGKRCVTASYGYSLDLDKMTFIPEDIVLYTYSCFENKARPELSHDEIEH